MTGAGRLVGPGSAGLALVLQAVRAFARIGWEWGGAWRYSKDYMHFSRNGR